MKASLTCSPLSLSLSLLLLLPQDTVIGGRSNPPAYWPPICYGAFGGGVKRQFEYRSLSLSLSLPPPAWSHGLRACAFPGNVPVARLMSKDVEHDMPNQLAPLGSWRVVRTSLQSPPHPPACGSPRVKLRQCSVQTCNMSAPGLLHKSFPFSEPL